MVDAKESPVEINQIYTEQHFTFVDKLFNSGEMCFMQPLFIINNSSLIIYIRRLIKISQGGPYPAGLFSSRVRYNVTLHHTFHRPN